MSKRHIRLKEWETDIERVIVPPDSFLAGTDGTLPKQPYEVKTSSDGFIIDPDREEAYRRRVMVLGDSVVECSFVRQGYRMTDVAERTMRGKGYSIRIENAGRSGATSLSHLTALLAKFIPLRPDLIVVMNGVIDADALIHEAEFWSRGEYVNPLDEPANTRPILSRPRENLDFSSRSKLLRLIAETCTLFGIKLALATFPIRGEDAFKDAYLKKHVKRDERLTGVNDHTRHFCNNNGVTLLDFQRIFSGRTDLFYDCFHLNEKGAGEVGTTLANLIIEAYPEFRGA